MAGSRLGKEGWSGGLVQCCTGRFTPEPIHQPAFENAGAETQASGGVVVVLPGFDERLAAQAAGLGHDLAGFAIGCDGFAPSNGAHANLTGGDQAAVSVENGDHARRVGPGAVAAAIEVILRYAALGFGEGIVERVVFGEAQGVVERDRLGVRIVVDEGRDAEAGDTKRIFRGAAKV